MQTDKSPRIPLKEANPLVTACAHHWVKIKTTGGHKALKCEFCGKVIDSPD